MSLEDDNPLM